MKLSIILVICLIASTMAVAPACLAASYCKTCSTTDGTTCDACFNYKLGTIGAKYKTGSTCTNSATAITNCKIYSSGLVAASTLLSGACTVCDSDYTTVETTAGGVVTPTCVATRPAACAAITDCMQVRCATSNAGTTYTSTCSLCDKGKGASAVNACAGTILANCDYSMWGSAQNCYYASSGYVVASTSLTVVAYTTDSNCQTLAASSTTQCQECWDGYYWNTTVCKLSAKVLGAAFLAVVALFIN